MPDTTGEAHEVINNRALPPVEPQCPYCHETVLLDVWRGELHCQVCGRVSRMPMCPGRPLTARQGVSG